MNSENPYSAPALTGPPRQDDKHSRGWLRKTLIVTLGIQSVGFISSLVFGRSFFWIHDVIYLPCWTIVMEGWLPWNIIGDHKLIDNYWIATVINFPLLWLLVVLLFLPYHVWLMFRNGAT